MQYSINMEPYIVTLVKKALEINVPILEAFKESGVPTSTYYRTMKGSELRYNTAKEVMDALHSLQRTNSSNRELGKDNYKAS